jgi:hypothetical protein
MLKLTYDILSEFIREAWKRSGADPIFEKPAYTSYAPRWPGSGFGLSRTVAFKGRDAKALTFTLDWVYDKQ